MLEPRRPYCKPDTAETDITKNHEAQGGLTGLHQYMLNAQSDTQSVYIVSFTAIQAPPIAALQQHYNNMAIKGLGSSRRQT